MKTIFGKAALFLVALTASLAVVWGDESVRAEPPGGSDATRDLERELRQVREALPQAQEAVAEVNKEYFRFQHDIVYTNRQVGAVYRDIKELERQLVEKRRELDELTHKLPEMRELVKKRNTAFKRLSDLREREDILNEALERERKQ
jgi:chromosome segregation ATPase